MNELTKIIEGKYPDSIENRKSYELVPVYDAGINELEYSMSHFTMSLI